ncbi:MAG: hypothetical protein A3E83_08185 [Gammaproteobacteria bacterium RIFCSPHIGHO2_12_FULL_41_20]|nr:MAG: hypothetical protein A3E83_08185 [Gammaproteobacteria bacterium RIFCSPHIGHO2_12_FULL_41_20]
MVIHQLALTSSDFVCVALKKALIAAGRAVIAAGVALATFFKVAKGCLTVSYTVWATGCRTWL